MVSKFTRTRLIMRNGKKVRENRWVMEQNLGRRLEKWEHVHHINGNPLDNRLENLEVHESREHMQLHKQIYPDRKICEVCGEKYAPNPRKRKRQKCCSPECAVILRTRNMSDTRGYSSRNKRTRSSKQSQTSKTELIPE
jgi:hypothetical protein